jgi:PP-loop superfamily ATP-utilizing enzyme
MRLLGAKDFIKSFREGPKVLIVCSGGNSSGWFLEVAVYAVGGRRGLILIPEGREERGWCRVAAELVR